ncbi:TonB-dependent receptor [Pelomonas sp. CA6]|uniref:TonB-dependent receptor plug domain-containing protein n=1 Tax=Pelomonas sp. CA6 TaxID=2907999 RepID=UPI001F4C3D39|nr:TonB-dependent receptor [Pelomonas sp. CA6]MCH7343462.1 TonB-dependent receptor [Pelomonas sp. CA6]
MTSFPSSHFRRVAQAAAAVCAGLAAWPLFAQTSEAEPRAQALERVEVTGSRIKRLEAETASAVQVISRDDIARSGALSVTDVLRDLPAGNVGGISSNGPVDATFGSAGISLRGLGVGSTLVLINGRRVAPFGFGTASFVDTSAIPVDAVERIETLLDGASAIYGADAIGGVVNIILRKGYEGLVGSGGYGRSSRDDGQSQNLSLTYGRGNVARDGYNLFLTYAHREQDPVRASARERTRDADFRRYDLADRRSSYYRNVYRLTPSSGPINNDPANFLGPLTGLDQPCTPASGTTATLNGRCLNDNTRSVSLSAGWTMDSVYGAGVLALPAGFELFADAALTRSAYHAPNFSYGSDSYGYYTYNQVDKAGRYGNAPGAQINYLILPVGHPQNPLADAEVGVRYLFNDVPGQMKSHSLNQRYTLGLRGELGGWDLESALMISRARNTTTQQGLMQDAVFVNEVLDANGKVRPGFILGNAGANDAGLMARLYPTLRSVGHTATESIDLRGSRELWQLPGGRLGVSLGAEYRREKVDSVPDTLLSSGAISLWNVQGVAGSRRVGAVYAEAVAPLLKGLELSLALRMDDNSDFGRSSTPKVGLKWQALPQLLLRGTYAEGFRAPTLPEQHMGTQTYYVKVRDPKRCPSFDAANPDCDRYVVGIYGASGDLKAETSKSISLGLVFQPLRQLSLAVDAYDIKRRGEVAAMSTSYLLDHEDQFPGKVVRGASSGQIDTIYLTSTNLAQTHVRGLDAEGRAQVDLPQGLGRLQLQATYNRLAKYEQANAPGAEMLDTAGYYLKPKERMRFGVAWDRGPWQLSVNWNYTGAYAQKDDPSVSCSYATQALARPEYCRIKSWLTADAYLAYRGIQNLELSLSVRNLDDRAAPFDADRIAYLQGFNPAYHNQLGRYIQLGAKYRFW